MNERERTDLQPCSLRARNSFRLGLPGVFARFTASLENTNIVSEFTGAKLYLSVE